MPLLEHIRELRGCLFLSLSSAVLGAIISFIFYDYIINLLSRPFQNLASGPSLFVNSIIEGFTIKIKVSAISGIVLSFPVHVFNIIRFVFPGLKSGEKKIIIYSLLASFLLIAGSAYWSYEFVIPYSVRFLAGKDFIPRNVGLLLNYGQNIFYIFQFFLFSLIVFQSPILLVIIMKIGLISWRSLLKFSRYVIVGIFVLSAVVTPPDAISQMALALPLTVLFFGAVLTGRIFHLGE